MWGLLSADALKSSQYAGDRGVIISKILVLEKKSKVEFELIHLKAKDNMEEVIFGRDKINGDVMLSENEKRKNKVCDRT